MGLNAHDLLKLQSVHDMVSYSTIPDWVFHSLKKAPYVVVRRASGMKGMAAVGVRGESRNQRFAAFLPYGKVVERITPELLAEKELWVQNERIHSIMALNSLVHIHEILAKHTVPWGPTGSVGFELASGVPTAKPSSDLDLVIRSRTLLHLEKARHIMIDLSGLAVRVDVQLETAQGAIPLLEYSRGDSPILLRTENGPRLVHPNEM